MDLLLTGSPQDARAPQRNGLGSRKGGMHHIGTVASALLSVQVEA